MNREQTAVILELIATMYQNKFKVDNPKMLIDLWHDALKDHNFEIISANLKEHFKTSVFPPSVAELLPKKDVKLPIPTIQETQLLLESYETTNREVATKEEVAEHLKKIRETLGVKGE